MKHSLKITVLSLVLAVPLVLPLTSTAAFGFGEWHTTLIQRLAQKLGIQQSQVESVFDDVHGEIKTEMQKKLEDRLTQAVKDGKLTEAQKQLILTKHKEIQQQREKDREAWKQLTPQQRKEKLEKAKTELETWAKNNNIDSSYIPMLGIKGMGRNAGR